MLSARRDCEQIVIIEIEDRTFEHGRERQIVFRQRQEIAEDHQVLHRDLIGQRDPVGARDGDATPLQRGDHRHRERIALAHEDQDVAGADRDGS